MNNRKIGHGFARNAFVKGFGELANATKAFPDSMPFVEAHAPNVAQGTPYQSPQVAEIEQAAKAEPQQEPAVTIDQSQSQGVAD